MKRYQLSHYSRQIFGNRQIKKGDSRRYFQRWDGRRHRRPYIPVGTIVDRELWAATRPREQREALGSPSYSTLVTRRRKAGKR